MLIIFWSTAAADAAAVAPPPAPSSGTHLTHDGFAFYIILYNIFMNFGLHFHYSELIIF